MFDKKFLSKLIFIDIETVAKTAKYDELPENFKKLWSERCEYLRHQFEDNADKDDAQLWEYKAGLHAEYNKVICVSFGRLHFKEEGTIFNVKSIYGDNEAEVIGKVFMALDQLYSKYPQLLLCGHNLKNFDFPILCKKAVINNKPIPKALQVHDKKPWESPLFDTMDVWGFGSWKEGIVNLKTICASLDIPTPKDDIDGSEVNGVYWKENDLERIVKYCEKDVVALARIMLRLSDIDEDVVQIITK